MIFIRAFKTAQGKAGDVIGGQKNLLVSSLKACVNFN
jgi:hypothetical protein